MPAFARSSACASSERPLLALHTFIENGRSDAATGRYKYERAFGTVMDSLERQCKLRQLAAADEGIRFRVLRPTTDGSSGFKVLGID